MRRIVLALLLVACCGCITPSTEITLERDPLTGKMLAHLQRDWLAGPLDVSGDYVAPDGTELHVRWASEVNLDAAVAAEAQRLAAMDAAVQRAVSAAIKTQAP